MTTKRDYAASITTKGLDGTGLTDDVARKLYSRRGRKAMAVVELVVDETSDKRDGSHKVSLAISGLELVLDHADIENHLRDLQQTIYANRQRADGQMAIDEQLGGERTVADVLASGKSHRPHPFIVVDASVENPICDVCGGIEASAVHSTQDILEDPEDDDQDDDTAADVEAEQDLIAEEWVDSQHGDAPEQPDDWSYPAPEGQPAAATVPDPFTTPATT